MNLEEALNRCVGDNLPDIIDSSAGLFEIPELGVIGIPTWGRFDKKKKRKAVLEITSFRGISFDAIHIYGKVIIDGVYTATIGNTDKPKNITREQEKEFPLLSYKYEFRIKRPLIQKEIDSDPKRWYAYDEGDLTEGYETFGELINDFKTILKLRFTGEWDFCVQYPNGKLEKI